MLLGQIRPRNYDIVTILHLIHFTAIRINICKFLLQIKAEYDFLAEQFLHLPAQKSYLYFEQNFQIYVQ